MDFEDETENRVVLMVHNIRPPFLDGRVVFTTQMQIVATVRARLRVLRARTGDGWAVASGVSRGLVPVGL